jgi:hypothetical protein
VIERSRSSDPALAITLSASPDTGTVGAMNRRAGIVAAALSAAACRDRPDDDELDRWRREAQAANVAALAAARHGAVDEPGHVLTVSGQIRSGRTVIGWDELERIGQTHVPTTSPQDPTRAGQVIDFRGVLVRDLLDRVGVAGDATELTFVSIDAFRTPVAIADARRFRTLLALAADGVAIPRAQGGPIFLVHPHSEAPETVTLYPDRTWSFYVTDVIVGTEPAALRVGDRTLDAAALDALPQLHWEGVVKYKSYWPSDPVVLRGVRLRDALRAAGAAVPVGGAVIVRGKAAIQRDPKDPHRIAAADVERCEILLATRWGDPRMADDLALQPIAPRLGGPITLAIPPACAGAYGDHDWLTFVEELVVEPAPGGATP